MHKQTVEKQLKDWEKQQKTLAAQKSKGRSSKDAKDKAISQAKRGDGGSKKGKSGPGDAAADRDDGPRDDELIARPKDYVVKFTFKDPPALAPPVLNVSSVSFRYGPKYPWLFRDMNFGIDQSSRISIVGPNGVGECSVRVYVHACVRCMSVCVCIYCVCVYACVRACV